MSEPATRSWLCGSRVLAISPRKPFLLGILNVTPDSFSDGGKYLSPGDAVRHGIHLLESADGLDVGGESTRPGAEPVSANDERKRVVGVLREIRKEMPAAVLSVDTYKAEVALAALEMAGVDVINDVGAGDWDPAMWDVLQMSSAGYICMHSRGRPRVMQINPAYQNVVKEVGEFFDLKRDAWVRRGMDLRRVVFDVGIGFGKRPEHNQRLLEANWSELARPLVWGLSRKSFLEFTQREKGLQDRDQAMDFWNRHLLKQGFPMVWRVHDPFKVRKVWGIFSDDTHAMAR